MKLENYKEAVIVLQKAIELEPELAIAYYTLGEVLYKQEKSEEAIQQFEKVVDLEPDGEIGHNAKEMIDELKGD